VWDGHKSLTIDSSPKTLQPPSLFGFLKHATKTLHNKDEEKWREMIPVWILFMGEKNLTSTVDMLYLI